MEDVIRHAIVLSQLHTDTTVIHPSTTISMNVRERDGKRSPLNMLRIESVVSEVRNLSNGPYSAPICLQHVLWPETGRTVF